MSNKREYDTRPVRCFICGKKMYYAGNNNHEPEFRINDDKESGYVHARCLMQLKGDKGGLDEKWILKN